MPYVEMPKLSDTMAEGTVVKWRKATGDAVKAGDVLAEIETDKAVMELEAFESGTLREIYVAEGGKARIGEKLALLLGANESVPQADDLAVSQKATTAPSTHEISPQPSVAVAGQRCAIAHTRCDRNIATAHQWPRESVAAGAKDRPGKRRGLEHA